MKLSRVCLAVVALVALQGCTKTVYYAVVAPNQEMDQQNTCFHQCQMLHSANTKDFIACAENCPGTRVYRDKQCTEVNVDRGVYGCTTMHNQALDKTALGVGIGLLVLLNIVIVAIAISNQPSTPTSSP